MGRLKAEIADDLLFRTLRVDQEYREWVKKSEEEYEDVGKIPPAWREYHGRGSTTMAPCYQYIYFSFLPVDCIRLFFYISDFALLRDQRK